MKLIRILSFAICASLILPGVPLADETEERYILMQEEEMRVKQMRADEIAQHVTAMKQQMEDERQRIRQANETIWEEFLTEQEVKKKHLEEQLAVIDERQRRFETELEKKRFQDNQRFTKRENELNRLALEMQRLHAEIAEDRKSLDVRIQAYNERARQATTTQSKFPSEMQTAGAGQSDTTVLANGAVNMGGFKPGEIMGAKPFHLRKTKNEYFLEIGDVLEVDVWKVDDLSRQVTVRPDGRISMPLVGDLEVVGMSLTELRNILTEKFSDYIVDPQVSIALRQFGGRKFIILGEVSNPGVYRYQQQIYLMEAIALAGGIRQFAKIADVMIIRGDIKKQPKVKIIRANLNNLLKQGMLTENISVMSNDIIYIGKGAIGDANKVIDEVIEPAFSNIIDFFVARSSIRTAQLKGA